MFILFLLFYIYSIKWKGNLTMNVQKIFDALEEDEMNSGLGVICWELERQGYGVEVEEIKVTADEIFNNKFPSLEEVPVPVNLKLSKDGIAEQEFLITFTDYHEVIISKSKH